MFSILEFSRGSGICTLTDIKPLTLINTPSKASLLFSLYNKEASCHALCGRADRSLLKLKAFPLALSLSSENFEKGTNYF